MFCTAIRFRVCRGTAAWPAEGHLPKEIYDRFCYYHYLMSEQLNQDLQSLRIDRSKKSGGGTGRRRFLWIPVGLLVLALAVLFSFGPDRLRFAGFGSKPREVEVAQAQRRDSAASDAVLTASGYVIPRRRVEVSSKLSGRVEELLVDRGDMVRAGQVLARLDDREFRAQLSQARANRQAAAARLAEAETGSRPQEIERAKAALNKAEANQRTAQINLDRAVKLNDRGVLSRQALDDARNAFDVANAQVNVARKNLELIRLGPRSEQILLARAQFAEAEASIAWWEAQLENTIIRAPISGTVLERLIEKGEMVTTGYVSGRGAKSALVSIADLSQLEVELDINESDIPRVHIEQECIVSPESYPDRKSPASVRELAPEANRQKATIQVKVAIRNPDTYLRPETNAKVSFLAAPETLSSRPANAVLVPRSAVVPGPAVFLLRDGRAVRREVSLGAEENGRVEILAGLAGGESVIVGGLGALTDGMSVVPKK